MVRGHGRRRRSPSTNGRKVRRRNESCRRCRGRSERRPRRKSGRRGWWKVNRRGQEDAHQLRGLRWQERLWRRFIWRHRLSGRLRNTIAAASPRLVLPVRDDRLTFRQSDLFARPENAVSHSVGNVRQLVLLETHDPHFGYVEVRVVVRRNRISQNRGLQLCSALDAARNHRVGIDGPRNQACGREASSSARRGPQCSDAGFFRDVAMRLEVDERDAESDYECQGVRPANGPKLSTQLSPKRMTVPQEMLLQLFCQRLTC